LFLSRYIKDFVISSLIIANKNDNVKKNQTFLLFFFFFGLGIFSLFFLLK